MVARTRALGVRRARARVGGRCRRARDFDAVFCVGNSLAHAPIAARALAGDGARAEPRRHAAPHLAQLGARAAAGSRLEVEDGSPSAAAAARRITRAWTIGADASRSTSRSRSSTRRHGHRGPSASVWPFTSDELLDDLRAAGLRAATEHLHAGFERYLVTRLRA